MAAIALSKPMKVILALALEWHEAGQDAPALRWDTAADKASYSRILRRLERRGLVVRLPPGGKARLSAESKHWRTGAIRLTEAGVEAAGRFRGFAELSLTISATSPPLRPPLVTATAGR